MSNEDRDESLSEHAAETPETHPETHSTAPIELAKIRQEYELSGLRRSDLDESPTQQLSQWLHRAMESKHPEPTAMTLATVEADGQPSSRVVLLKGFDDQGLRFFSNYSSDKGRQLQANPRAAASFFWPELQRQVRIEGSVSQLPQEVSAEYFSSRPHASQLAAWCSPQSQVIAGRAELESRWREAENRFAGREVDLPATWGGYLLTPQSFEFWQGRRSRLHDRFRYRLTVDGRWLIERLAP